MLRLTAFELSKIDCLILINSVTVKNKRSRIAPPVFCSSTKEVESSIMSCSMYICNYYDSKLYLRCRCNTLRHLAYERLQSRRHHVFYSILVYSQRAIGLTRVKSQKSCLHLEHQCGKQELAPPHAPFTRYVGLLEASKKSFGRSNVGAMMLVPSAKTTLLP